jgi:WXG100 family type VII secretion target
MSDFETGSAELLTAAGQMMDTNELLMDNGRKLAQAVDAIAGQWVGAAAMAFTNLMAAYQNDFTNLNTALSTISEQVTGSATLYQQQEDAAAADVSAIAATLDG